MGTKISWTDETWNPVTGCSRVSDGCTHCYAETFSLRVGWSTKPWTKVNAAENVVLHPERLRIPYRWKQPSKCFVNSMSDLFHEQVPDAFIMQIFAVMADLPQHTFQVLTKRPERAAAWPGPWTGNIWMGTSVEDRKALPRIETLRRCGAQTRFLSCEPLLEDLGDELDLRGIDWLIAGGESGVHMRASPGRWMDHGWARHLRDQCVAQRVAFYFKQSSGVRSELGTALVELDGTTTVWRQYPPAREG
jgi:protein gp37